MKWLEQNLEHQLAMKSATEDEELLNMAAAIMRRNHERQAETGAHAQTIVSHAQEELKIVERLLQESESGRIAAEMELKKIQAKLEEVESLFETRVMLAKQEQSALETCVQSAEARAKAAEESLTRLKSGFRALFSRYAGDERLAGDDFIASPSMAPLEQGDGFLDRAIMRTDKNQ